MREPAEGKVHVKRMSLDSNKIYGCGCKNYAFLFPQRHFNYVITASCFSFAVSVYEGLGVPGSSADPPHPSPCPLPHQIRPEMISRVPGRKPCDWLAGLQPPTGLHRLPEAVFAPLPLYHCKSSASILLEPADADIWARCKLIGGTPWPGPPASLNLLHQSAPSQALTFSHQLLQGDDWQWMDGRKRRCNSHVEI